MRKIITVWILFIFLCYLGSRKYNYTDHKVYIYKFKPNYNIEFIDRYNSHFIFPVDSIEYEYFREHRKSEFKLRYFDDNRIKIYD